MRTILLRKNGKFHAPAKTYCKAHFSSLRLGCFPSIPAPKKKRLSGAF
jgi:hypothetical protein